MKLSYSLLNNTFLVKTTSKEKLNKNVRSGLRTWLIAHCFVCVALVCLCPERSNAQAIKTNVPFILAGSPNIGVEFGVGSKFTVNVDGTYMPYLWKKKEEVFRVGVGSIDLRYYVSPRSYYTHDAWEGFYIGPYAMGGAFNIGLARDSDRDAEGDYQRRKGWGISSGVSTGYKFYLSSRLHLDCNIGLGYAHMQYDKFKLGGAYAEYPTERKKTKEWIGPTKFGVHLVYNIFR